VQFAGAKVGAIFKMEDEKENLSLLQQTFFFGNLSLYFWQRKQQRAGNFERARVLNGVRNYVW